MEFPQLLLLPLDVFWVRQDDYYSTQFFPPELAAMLATSPEH